MADQTKLRKRLEFRETTLDQLYAAYQALVKGGVKSYTIDDRELTRFDLPALKKEIEALEEEIDALEGLLNDKRPRKAVGIVPRDW